MGNEGSKYRPEISSFLESEMIALQGTDSVKVYVHEGLWNAIYKDVENCWWSSLPSGTIKRFVEFLYQGDYTTPPPGPLSVITMYGQGNDSGAKEKQKEITQFPAPTKFKGYEGVLLSHAELFIIGHSQDIDILRDTSFLKLNRDLEEAEAKLPKPIFLENIVELFRYSYSQNFMSNSPAWGDLQEHLSKMWVEKIELLHEIPISSLFIGEGKLMKDLMSATTKSLVEMKKKQQAAEPESA
ncbi:hypothetical protein L873DRAFT_1791295 [Choiromyces venosus 120613-1]|uniref:BTB domain-containing protein n=1 Tax=Choiromyces venosus 120613-1 TaxID=1336337 RepID=A0A3N4JFG9_9PEZI|nr:hypothetical protein L873DRAFT_1791295 [Choiromyces venosus 120613-1]